MRRFSLMIFALAVVFAIARGSNDDAGRGNADHPASADSEVQGTAGTPQAAAAELSEGRPAGAAPQQVQIDAPLLKSSAVLQKPRGDVGQGLQSDYVTSEVAHISASAKTGGIDPVLEGLTGSNLNAVAQGELKRLGCYDAKVDGKWGRKSQAAVKAFGERAGSAWADTSRRELVAALRNYPAAFCTTECAARTAGGQCVAAAAPKTNQAPAVSKDTSYLPPWMQDAKLTNVALPQTVAPGEQKTPSDAPSLAPKPKKSKNARRRGGERDRAAQRYERRRTSSQDWLPQGWPGGR